MLLSFMTMPAWLSTILSIIVAILILLVMITVHELGHFTAGKIFKFKINEFAIGFGKPLFKRTTKSGQVFSLRMIPLGGFCAFEGDDEEKDTPGAFNKQAPWKRLIVLFSGAFFNFLFAIIIVIFSFGIFGQFMSTVAVTHDVRPDNQQYVFQEGDIIYSLNGKEIYISDDLTSATKGMIEGLRYEAVVIRDGEKQNIEVLYREYEYTSGETSKTAVGLGISLGTESYRFSFFESLGRSFVYIFKMLVATLLIPGKLIMGIVGIDQVGGPITTIGMTAQFVQLGFHYVLEICAMIGISLAVFNLFPIPALDGARMVFTTIEWIRKKPINRKVEGYIHAVGLILLFSLVILIDILHFI